MWNIVDTYELRNLQRPETLKDLLFPTREMAEAFVNLNLDEDNRYRPSLAVASGPRAMYKGANFLFAK